MGIKSYYETSKKDIDRALEEYLNKNEFDSSFNDIDESKLSELVYSREQAERILLKKSDRESFLIELKRLFNYWSAFNVYTYRWKLTKEMP